MVNKELGPGKPDKAWGPWLPRFEHSKERKDGEEEVFATLSFGLELALRRAGDLDQLTALLSSDLFL